MKLKLSILPIITAIAFTKANSQTQAQDSTYRKFFIGISLAVSGNLIPNDANRPDFSQLNFGYQITPNKAL